MISNDKLSFREIADRWAKKSGEPADVLLSRLLASMWRGELSVIRRDNGTLILRPWVLKQIRRICGHSGWEHPGITLSTNAEGIPGRKIEKQDGGVDVDLNAHIVLQGRAYKSDVKRAFYILSECELSDYCSDGPFEILLRILAIGRAQFTDWYLAQDRYDRPDLDVIWPSVIDGSTQIELPPVGDAAKRNKPPVPKEKLVGWLNLQPTCPLPDRDKLWLVAKAEFATLDLPRQDFRQAFREVFPDQPRGPRKNKNSAVDPAGIPPGCERRK